MSDQRIDRGQRAVTLADDPILKDSLDATRDWAVRDFHAATNKDEAWEARLRLEAVEQFAAYLLATIQMGRSEVAKLVEAREKMSQRKRAKEELNEYLDNARKARRKFEEESAKVA